MPRPSSRPRSTTPVPPAARPAMSIRPEALAYSRVSRPVPAATPWTILPPPPGAAPKGKVHDTLAADYAPLYGEMGGYGGLSGEGIAWFGFPYLAELAQRPEYRRITETIAREMTRKGFALHSTGDDDKTDRIAAMNAGVEKFKVNDLLRRYAEHDGYFGRGHIFVDMGASDEEMTLPLFLDPRKVKKGSLKALRNVEPYWVYPTGYNSTDPLAADFYKPGSWRVQGRQIHATRLLTGVGREVADILKPAYQFGGLSMSQMAKPYVDNWLRTRQSVSDLINAFSVFHLATNMSAVLTGVPGAGDSLYTRAQMFTNYRTNDGLMLTDKDSEEFSNVSAQLGTLDKLQAQAQEHICSVTGLPLVVYTGISPAGLNATAAPEIELFNTVINSAQMHLFGPALRTILDLIQLSECGDIDPEIGFTFNPLGDQNQGEMAARRKTDADTAAVYIAANVIMPDEERQRLATSEDSLYANLDLSLVLPDPVAEEPEEPGETDAGGEVTETEADGGDEA